MTLTQDWMYIQYKQMLFVSVSASVPLTARAYVSVDGESYQEVSELLGQRTVLGYQPLFPIWMSGWLFADGQRIWVRIEDGEEVEEADYYVDYSVLAPKKARSLARTMADNTLSSTSSSFTLENIFNVPHVTEMPSDGSSCWLVNEQGSISYEKMANTEMEEIVPSQGSVVYPNTEPRTMYINSRIIFWDTSATTQDLSRLDENKVALFSNKKIYIRFDLSNDYDALLYSVSGAQDITEALDVKIIILYRNNNIVSSIIDIGTMSGYFFPYVLLIGKLGSQPPIITESEVPEASNPVLINITDNEANFAALGLTTDEEIKAYLDAIPYEDIEKPIQIGDQPTTPEYNVGDTVIYGGIECVIAYKAETDQSWGRYILCEKYDLNHYIPEVGTGEINAAYTGKTWGFHNTETLVQDTAIGTGKDNTDSLLAMNTEDSIWYYVQQHRDATGKAWSVPSKDEGWVFYEKRDLIGNFSVNGESYGEVERDALYWTSSESEQWSDAAYITDFYFDSQPATGKINTRVRVRCICYATDADLYNEHLANAYLDGVGLAFFWGKMKDYVDSALGSVQSILPIPLASCSIDGGSALLTLDATYSGYGEITVRYKKDSEPTEADTVLDPVNGAEITENGSYYVRAFGGSYTPSPSCIVEVSGIVVPVTVPMALPDGSVLFYDRGTTYGEYCIGDDGYPVRLSDGVDDGSSESVNWRYLICDSANLTPDRSWGADTSEGLTSTAIGVGLPNTEALLAKYSSNSSYIWQLVQNKRNATGGKKWFVPSKDELNIVYQNKDTIVNAGGGSFPTDDYYWSSSEYDSDNAWCQSFSDYDQGYGYKFLTCHCRSLRRV